MINILIFILFSSVIAILSVSIKRKGIITVSAVIVIALITSVIAIRSLIGSSYEILFSGTELFGNVPVRVDALSAWFILTN